MDGLVERHAGGPVLVSLIPRHPAHSLRAVTAVEVEVHVEDGPEALGIGRSGQGGQMMAGKERGGGQTMAGKGGAAGRRAAG